MHLFCPFLLHVQNMYMYVHFLTEESLAEINLPEMIAMFFFITPFFFQLPFSTLTFIYIINTFLLNQ